jgi:hypothetical protein
MSWEFVPSTDSEVEKVISHTCDPADLFYLIKWTGYSEECNSLDPSENCANCEEKVAEYWDGLLEASRSLGMNDGCRQVSSE